MEYFKTVCMKIYFKIIFLISPLISIRATSQEAVINININFDSSADNFFLDQLQRDYYIIDPYIPNQKSSISIYADRRDTLYYNYYGDNLCLDSSNGVHGFYVGITVYRKGAALEKELLVLKLTRPLEKGSEYGISYDAIYHKNVNYSIDSLQVLFIEQEKDIKSFLAEKLFNGMYVGFSAKKIENKIWQKITSQFTSDGNYNYMIIGNLKSNNDVIVSKKNNCNCGNREKGFWDYSEVFIDNISIIQK